ncbi:MAG TPA: ABC transporter permease subunit [Bdellovibrio sp.]|uniref:ABC transporter permease n=1 Tax=Bdellovibrio sp. TaxID=28201 RepID=UPI002F048B38
MKKLFQLPPLEGVFNRNLRLRWVDIAVMVGLLMLFWVVGSLGRDMFRPFSEYAPPQVSLEYGNIPYYLARSTLRMFLAYFCSLGFTLSVGYLAAHSIRARGIILPALDILQSVPVLGFLSATVTGFMSLFPGSLMGLEMASIFAIFTGQVWNMTFGFYHSLVTIPKDLTEAAGAFGLSRWQRFKMLEVPSSMIGLIWNSMMSFGGGWFFVVQSEAINVLNKNFKLPGLGSYMGLAIEKGDTKAAMWAVVAMVLMIVALDQLLWRPVVAWSQKFRVELTESSETSKSWVLEALLSASWIRSVTADLRKKISKAMSAIEPQVKVPEVLVRNHRSEKLASVIGMIFMVCIWGLIVYYSIRLVREIQTGLSLEQILDIVKLGFYTMLRVLVMVVVATAVWTPIGVWIGFRPRVAALVQPIAQIAASFPVNMTFPFAVGFFVAHSISMNWGSVLLIALGTQWYILFNVIAGASSVPSDLKESAKVFGLRGWGLWKKLIIPGIFPYWVTGACTAAGGAWNASIVAEFARWGDKKLVADGLGAFIADVTEKGDWPAIFCSIVVMSLFVTVLNKLVWRRLYDLAEKRFRLE